MAGVIMNGIQYEHCCKCGQYKMLSDLGYLPPSEEHKNGLDLCVTCVNDLPQEELERVVPAPIWLPMYEETTQPN